MRTLRCTLLLSFSLVGACQTAQQAKEIRLLGFEDDASKGKSVGTIEGSDCVFHVFGYWLGGQPTLSRAVINARKGKTGSIGDSLGSGDGGSGNGGVRYFNNMAVRSDGFNAGIFGKNCIEVTATGYK